MTSHNGGTVCQAVLGGCRVFVPIVMAAFLFTPQPALSEESDVRSQFSQFLETRYTDAEKQLSNLYLEMYIEQLSTKSDYKAYQLQAISIGKKHSLLRTVNALTKPLEISEEAWRRESPVEDASTGRMVGMINPRYVAIVRANSKPNTVDSIRPSSYPDEIYSYAVFPFGIQPLQRSFKTLVSDPAVRFEEFGSISAGGKELVRVVFVSDRREVERLVPWRFEAFLDPERGQTQRLVARNLDTDMVEEHLAEYSVGETDMPRLSALRTKFWSKGEVVATGRTLFRNYKQLEFPDNSRFYLPHYGIPEPAEFARGRGIPWGWWLVAVGAGLVVVSLVLRRFRAKS